jgi:hypothetical protein
MVLVKLRNTGCPHKNYSEVCFHGTCQVLRTFQNGDYLIENELGFVTLVESNTVKEVEN